MADQKGGKWTADDVEDVYPGAVFDGAGKVKDNPIHVVIPNLIPVPMGIKMFEASGLNGLLEMFLPPFTSEEPAMRGQQIVALVCMFVLHFYRLIIYNVGSCPGLILGSFEPETMKTTTSQIGLRAFGDPSHFLECSSSKESIEVRQTNTTLPTLLDDGNRNQAMEDILVGSYQAAAKSTISRGATEKLGGIAVTRNFKKTDTMNPKIREGRVMLVVMEKVEVFNKGVSYVRENYTKKIKHTNAMNSNQLPRDYCAEFKKHFLYSNEDESETEYQNVHMSACEILAEVKPDYDPRRLEALAHPIAFVMLIQNDVEELNQEEVTRVFVEVFGERKAFFKMYIEELNKADKVIEDMTIQFDKKPTIRDDNEDVEDGENIDMKVEKILDRFKESDDLERTMFVKGFIEKNKSQVLAIAHTKLDQYDKTWSNLKFPKLPTGFTKPFTRNNAISTSGHLIGATCKLFPLKNMNLQLQQRIRNLFPELKSVHEEREMEEEEEQVGLTAFQDFPGIQQSQGTKTLKNCKQCNYHTRLEEDMNNHMSIHPRCDQCKKIFSSDASLKFHMKTLHEHYICNVCKASVHTSRKDLHRAQHKTENQFGKGLEKGKVSKTKKATSDKVERKLDRNKAKELEEAEKDLMKEFAAMKKRFHDVRVKAVTDGKDVTKVKVPKKRIAIEKPDGENMEKKKKLSFIIQPSIDLLSDSE